MISYTKNSDIKFSYLKLQEKIDIVRATIPEEFFINV